VQGLQHLGWIVGRNVELDVRWAGPYAEDLRKHATELVALAPDVILANGSVVPIQRTGSITFHAILGGLHHHYVRI
jgi:hypothetical protein